MATPLHLRARIGKAFLASHGWTLVGGVPPVRKAVFIAAPHTSNWDLAYMLAAAWGLGIELRWIGKEELFVPPLGWVMRGTGGIGVHRREKRDQVQAIADVIDAHDDIFLGIPPEGTRGKAKRWKSGFYWIAVAAKVPIILAFLDYEHRRVGLGDAVLYPTGDIEKDFERIRAFYMGMKGKRPELQGEIALRADE